MSVTYVRNEETGEFEKVGLGSATTDTTLSLAGKPADAAAVGSALSGYSKTNHSHSEYVNKNAFSNITIGSTTIAADSTADTLTVVAGSNITLTPDATNDKITIAATNTTYSAATTSAAGLMSATDKSKLDTIAESADSVSFSRSLTSGTKVGTITINGAGTDLYAPAKAGITKLVTYAAGTTATSYSFTPANYDVLMLGLTPSTSGAICCVSIPAATASSGIDFQVADESNYCKWTLSSSSLTRVTGTGNIRYIYGVKY